MGATESKSSYSEGHLFVAAMRVLEHQHGAPPSLEQIAALLRLSNEQVGLIARRMHAAGIVAPVEKAFADRWTVADHLKLEDLPREVEASQLDSALQKFQAERDAMTRKIASIKEQQERKRKDLFADIEKKLKKDLGKDTESKC